MNFSEMENRILKFWESKGIFNKLRDNNKGKEPWSFLDGPITANNPMGAHHGWGRTYKDMFQRYKAMKGFDQRFRNGFDCQGLWVEVEVEKELGFKNKKDIEKYGIDKFVNKCKERVFKYSKIQTAQSIRLGQWMDWGDWQNNRGNSYYTMSDENNYAIWHFLKKCHQQGLLYKGRDSVPWCPRCGTSISQHEILTEEYKEITHKSIFFKLPVKGKKKTYFLVWTTTPWTLPGNSALAVHPDLDYAKVKDGKDDVFIALKQKVDLVEGGAIIETIKGKDLEGMEYKGMFDNLPNVKRALGKYKHRVILWKDITEDEGTGIVHIAPGCGAEDFGLAKELDLPVIDLTDSDSRYRDGFDELSGKFVGSDDARQWLFDKLEKKQMIFRIEDYKHRYPTCWRCKTELIFRVVDEWYISMNKLREPLMESAKKIKWMPGFGLDRELDWLKNMHDWLISKKRYWGLALPIYECQCGNIEVIGSKVELNEKAVSGWDEFEGKSPHRPWVDKVKIRCSKCGKEISRIADVGTPWLDAGITPFSTISENNVSSISNPELKDAMPSYFEDKKLWQKWFPINFICESFPGQFKNWFYTLLVMSQVLEGCPPFKTVLGFASVVDEKGEEMHKSKGNAIWFDEAVEKIGADVMRWMYVKQNPASNIRFGYNSAKETNRKLLTLLNCFTFFKTHCVLPDSSEVLPSNSQQGSGLLDLKNILDKWIVSKLNGLVKKVSVSLDKFDAMRASLAIEDFFINDLSLWYLRRTRKRLSGADGGKQAQTAQQVFHCALLTLTKLMAPMTPFLAEDLYQQIKTKQMPESVHLFDFPVADEKLIDQVLEQRMATARDVCAGALAMRAEQGIRVRQPLTQLFIKNEALKDEKGLLDLIADEVNVKKIVFNGKIEQEIELDIKLTDALKKEGDLRELIRHIQDLRKKAGLTPKDKAVIYYSADDKNLAVLISKNKKTILKQTKSEKLKENKKQESGFSHQKQSQINGQVLWLAVEKV